MKIIKDVLQVSTISSIKLLFISSASFQMLKFSPAKITFIPKFLLYCFDAGCLSICYLDNHDK